MTGEPPSTSDAEQAVIVEERRRVALLLRWLAVFVAVPTVTIGLALYAYDPAAHVLHMGGFLLLGALAFLLMGIAPRLASRWVV